MEDITKHLFHAESYESSPPSRKVSRIPRNSCDSSGRHKNSLGACTPTHWDEGLGRSRGISFSGQVSPSPHRKSFDVNPLHAGECTFSELLAKPGSSCSCLPGIQSEEDTPERQQSVTEDDKREDKKSAPKGTFIVVVSAGTPTRISESSFDTAGSLPLTPTRRGVDSPGALRASRSPNPLQQKLNRAEFTRLISCAEDPDNPFHHLYESKRRSSASVEAYKEFLFTLFGSIALMHQLGPLLKSSMAGPKLSLPRPAHVTSNKTLVFDLDETLVHEVDQKLKADASIGITLPNGSKVTAGINLRPGLEKALRELSKIYEIVVFTSSHRNYADAILDYLDKDKHYISHRLYRDHCLNCGEDIYIKDLRIIDRDPRHVIIIDNSPYAFALQIDNGYPIIPYSDDIEDIELEVLTGYLTKIKDAEDVRVINKEAFNLGQLSLLGVERYFQYYGKEATGSATSGLHNELHDLRFSLKEFFLKSPTN